MAAVVELVDQEVGVADAQVHTTSRRCGAWSGSASADARAFGAQVSPIAASSCFTKPTASAWTSSSIPPEMNPQLAAAPRHQDR